MAVEFGGKMGDRHNFPEGRRSWRNVGRPKNPRIGFSWKKSSIQFLFNLNLHGFWQDDPIFKSWLNWFYAQGIF